MRSVVTADTEQRRQEEQGDRRERQRTCQRPRCAGSPGSTLRRGASDRPRNGVSAPTTDRPGRARAGSCRCPADGRTHRTAWSSPSGACRCATSRSPSGHRRPSRHRVRRSAGPRSGRPAMQPMPRRRRRPGRQAPGPARPTGCRGRDPPRARRSAVLPTRPWPSRWLREELRRAAARRSPARRRRPCRGGTGRAGRPRWRRRPVTRRIAARLRDRRPGPRSPRPADAGAPTHSSAAPPAGSRRHRPERHPRLAGPCLGGLATSPVLEHRADRERAREAVGLLVRRGAGGRRVLGEAAVAVVGSVGSGRRGRPRRRRTDRPGTRRRWAARARSSRR